MTSLGYALSGEKHAARDLVDHAAQVGPDQEGFLDFAARSLLPEFDREPTTLAS